MQEQLEQQEPSLSLSRALSGAVRAGAPRSHHSLGSRHSYLELFRATLAQGCSLLPFSPCYPPCTLGHSCSLGGRAPLLFLAACCRLALAPTSIFHPGQDKISLSCPSSAAVRDITPSTPVFPGSFAVTVLKPGIYNCCCCGCHLQWLK